MNIQFGLPAPEPLDLSGGNTSENWKKFKQKYTNYEIATGINEKESAIRVATLLTVIGNDAYDVFNMITWDAEGDDKRIDKVLQKFEEHCEPKKNVTYERYQFFSRAHVSGKTIDEYVTVLRKLSETCEFGTLRNSLIKDRIVLGVNNCTTRERLLGVHVLTLEKAVDVVRSAEMTEKQAQKWESDPSVQDSIMALHAPKSQSNQSPVYEVPGSTCITLQQQPHPNTHPSGYRNISQMPAQDIPREMTRGMKNLQQQQQAQQQMQQLPCKKLAIQRANIQSGQGEFRSSLQGTGNGWMSSQQPMSFPQPHAQYVTTGTAPNSMNYVESGQRALGSSLSGMGNGWMSSQQPVSFPQPHAQYVTTGTAPNSMNYVESGQRAFGSSLPWMENGWMSSQQPMSFPQQQHAQYVTTGPSPNSMNYGGYPVGLMPGSGQTMSHQLWK
ncbi:uncharacterized protein [Montipora capricornis]|uniref:uncharacterized protein n=1 Tax=Montipora capricornis TaxID=246305 RepID=UPI0035F1C457